MKYIEEIEINNDKFSVILGNSEMHYRKYENNVFINFTIRENNKIYIFLIESEEKGKGNGTLVMQDFLNEFQNYEIVLDAVEYAIDWYKQFGFKQIESINNGGYVHMILKKGA